MSRPKRNIEAFSLSFLDCICCGFGAIILLLVLSKIYEPVVFEETQEDLQQLIAMLQEQLFEIQGQTTVMTRALTAVRIETDETKLTLAQLQKELNSIQGQYKLLHQEDPMLNINEGELKAARQRLSAEMQRLRKFDRAPDDAVGGIPVDSEYIIFVVDTSGSMQQKWGWVEKKLSDICGIKHGFAFKSKFFNSEGDYVVLTPGSFYESGGFREQGEKTKFYIGEIPDGFILEEGNFLFAMTEQAAGLLGSSLIVPESDKYLHNQRLGLVQVTNGSEWHNDFFFHQFNTRKFRSSVHQSASGVKVRHTSPKKLGAVSICCPPTKSQQEAVAERINKLSVETQNLKTLYQKKLTALTELKQSILQKAFAGELTAEPEELKALA